MDNKQRYNLNVVFAKGKHITDLVSTYTGNGGNSRTHCWMLILMIWVSGATRSKVALWAYGSVGCVSLQAKGDV